MKKHSSSHLLLSFLSLGIWEKSTLDLLLQGELVLVLHVLVVNGSVLVLLVLADQIVHVGLSLSELGNVHTLVSVPMQESLSSKHGGELVTDTLEELLDRGGVGNEGSGHLSILGRNAADGGLHIVGNPLNKVGRVALLNAAHLILNLLDGDLTTEKGSNSEVSTALGVGGSHHVLGVKELLGQLGDSQRSKGLLARSREGGIADHEKVQTGERHQVNGELSQVRVELARETQAGGDARHDTRNKLVEIGVGRLLELEGMLANVVESLVVDTEGLVGVLNQLMNGKSGIVGFDNGIRNLGGGDNRESSHHSIGVLFTDLGNQESTHTGTGTTTKRVGDLETLERVTVLGLASHDIKNRVNKLSTFSVVTLGPVVTGTGLTKNEVVGAEEVAVGTTADSVHDTRLQINENGSGNVLAVAGLIVVDAKALKLLIIGTLVAGKRKELE